MIINNPNFRRRKYSSSSLRGLGSDPSSNINPTTIWTPSTGFLSTPGVVAAADLNVGTPTYQSPTLLGPPTCASGPTMFTSECQQQVIANNLHDLGQASLSNYNVDLYNCLNTFPQPSDCYNRTFGLTPMGGSGSYVGLVNNPINFLTGMPGVSTNIPTDSKQLTSTPNQQTQQVQTSQMSNGSGSGVQDISSLASGRVSILGHDIPLWGLVGVGIVGLVLVTSRH